MDPHGSLGPFGVVVDTSYVYWTYSGGSGAVWRQPIAGGDPTVFAKLGGFPRAMVSDGDALYVAGGCDGDVWRVPLATGSPQLLTHVGAADSCVHGIAVDQTSVYFTTGGVARVPIAGGQPTMLAGPVPSGDGCNGSIALAGSELYWVSPCSAVDPALGALNTLDGGGVAPLDGGKSSGDAIAVDANAVYWAADGAIKRRSLSDATTTMLAQTGEVFGLAVDSTSIYWTTADSVETAPLAGGAPSLVTSIPGPAGIALDASNVYWGGGTACPAGSVPK